MTAYTLWKKEEERAFDEEFPSPDGHDFIGMERISSLKSFLASHDQRLLALVGEIVEGMIKEETESPAPDKHALDEDGKCEQTKYQDCRGCALSDLQSKLSALIEEKK